LTLDSVNEKALAKCPLNLASYGSDTLILFDFNSPELDQVLGRPLFVQHKSVDLLSIFDKSDHYADDAPSINSIKIYPHLEFII
jgi:hypothetical protein